MYGRFQKNRIPDMETVSRGLRLLPEVRPCIVRCGYLMCRVSFPAQPLDDFSPPFYSLYRNQRGP